MKDVLGGSFQRASAMFYDVGAPYGCDVPHQISGKLVGKNEPSADFMFVGIFPLFILFAKFGVFIRHLATAMCISRHCIHPTSGPHKEDFVNVPLLGREFF